MYSKTIIIGNLGRDPEMRFLPSGQAVTNISVATNRRYNDSSGQKVDETTWFRVSVWGSQAEACNQYLKQGSRVLVEGRLKPDENGNPNIFSRGDGSPGASFEITASNVLFLSSKNEDTGQSMADDVYRDSLDEDNIPF